MPIAIKEEVSVPKGVEVGLECRTVEVSGPKGKLSRKFDMPGIKLRADGQSIFIEAGSSRRRHRAAVGMIRAHLQNMFKGVTEGFTYKLRVVYSHFPLTVKIENKRVLIHNFLGGRAPRIAKIVGNASVNLGGDEIIVEGVDKDEVGQTAFNIEQATFIKHLDPRVFQDGCYIVERA